MQSWVEVDEEDLYTLKINCKEKRTVEKANKGISIEKYNRSKKIKIIKKEKRVKTEEERKRGEGGGEFHRTAKAQKKKKKELQKLNVEAEVYKNNIAWRIAGPGDPGGLPSLGLHRVGHDWSDLAAAAAAREHFMQRWAQ